MIEDIEILKKLAKIGGRIGKDKYLVIYCDVMSRLGFHKIDVEEKDIEIKEYLHRRYKVGGSRLKSYIAVVKSYRGMEGRIKKMLGKGEDTNER